MSLLSKVTRSMRKIAPLELAETSWDNVGVLVGKSYAVGITMSRKYLRVCNRTSFPLTKTKQSVVDYRLDSPST